MANEHVAVTDLIHGPFCIVVTDPKDPNSKDYPVVIAPSGGYGTTVTMCSWED